MRIVILANSSVGLYKFRHELIEQMLNMGHEIYISVPNGDLIQPLIDMGCTFIDTKVDRRGVNPIKDLMLMKEYKRIIKQIDPDYVITYTIKPNIYGSIAAKKAKKAYAVNITGLGTAFETPGFVRTIVINLYKYALKKAKVIFFENSGDRETFLSYKCCRREQTHLLNGAGVNTESFSYMDYPDNDVFRFLFVGRVMKEKGIEELFDAMIKLQKENTCCLDVVGPCEENYKDLLSKYEAEGWLMYHGYQSDVRPFIANCDCFVLPSYHEGMANTNLESASSGRPVITSNIPGCKESVVDGVSGFLCEPKNADSLFIAMKKMMNHPDRETMGRAGRNHMISVFEKKKVVNDTISVMFGSDSL